MSDSRRPNEPLTFSGGRVVQRVFWRRAPVRHSVLRGGGWFVLQMLALWLGVVWLATLYGTVTGLAGWQLARRWGRGVNSPVTGSSAVLAGLMPFAALLGSRWVGGVVLVGVVLAFVLAGGSIAEAGLHVQHWLFVGVFGACVVLTAGYELGAAVVLLWLMAMYDAGEYLVGAGARSPWLGLLAGMVGAAVVSVTVIELGIPPLNWETVWRFSGTSVVLLPLGPVAGSLLLPRAWSEAPAMRRVDSGLLLAPAWAWMIGLLVADVA